MEETYNFQQIELKWQKIWEEERASQVQPDPGRPKFYCLEMFPYPSGRIHMGHVRNYSIGDVISRYLTMKGFNVLHPIGWDALGLPAENAAIKHGIPPRTWTMDNIAHMKAQLKRLGLAYDWSREVATCLPDYYRWNQWIFLKMYERGLAFRRKSWVNWCPQCRTVLANEQAQGDSCWRCDSGVEQKKMEHWFLKITDYAEELLSGHAQLTKWPEHVLLMQKNWIGKSEGTRLHFPVSGLQAKIEVFTTRVDTIFGAMFLVLSPEHPLVPALIADSPRRDQLQAWVERNVHEAHLRRDPSDGNKEGFDTGRRAINPYSGEEIPIWIANYVLMEYGTGAIMAVPAHDQRDYEFALKYGLPVRTVILPEDGATAGAEGQAFEPYGRLTNSGAFSGLLSEEAIAALNLFAETKGFGRRNTVYRLRDWGVSRQRYWGTPIPIVYCEKCGVVPVPYEDLPVEIPADVSLTGTEGSPLERSESFVNTICPKCRGKARRETDTMDTFFDSSWYFFRYASPQAEKLPFERRDADYWLPVDLYIGGVEHAILHLIYARFFTKVLRDLGLTSLDEPFPHYLAQGMVTKDGSAMSKSKGNVVDPDEMIAHYGADALRLFILFASPPEKEFAWNEDGIEGCYRFLGRVWQLFQENKVLWAGSPAPGTAPSPPGPSSPQVASLRKKMHQTIKKVGEDIGRRYHLNTAISSIMELVNQVKRDKNALLAAEEGRGLFKLAIETIVLLLAPFAPHLCEEMGKHMGRPNLICRSAWPEYDQILAQEETMTIIIQVNGKLRDRLEVRLDTPEEELKDQALCLPRLQALIGSRPVRHVICVKNKLVNIVL
jgi:leucyl-tRNA synthetase